MSAPVRRARPRLTLLALATAVSVATGIATPATAGAEPAPPSLPDLAEALSERPAARSFDVTLVTGDVVQVNVDAGGSYQVTTELAPRPNGRPVVVQTLTDDNHVYVLPSDAAQAFASGRVDRRLFDIRYLIENGYADPATSSLPLIVEYAQPTSPSGLATRAGTLPAAAPVRTLESIDAVAVSVPKGKAGAFWTGVAPNPRTRSGVLSAGVERLWLDGRVQATLDESVPMIGAPEAWAAGLDGTGVTVAVLDTGIDPGHPDVADQIVAERSFVPDVTSGQDGNGHGTHVASTVTGTGAASDGRYRGVAPGADLIVGKVLNDNGKGQSSWIIDGMEWAAAEQDADIVSMSLGGDPTDGTDMMSRTVNELTQETGALFVIAAGNTPSGAQPYSVGAPGAATRALTVGAVDKSDVLAAFSNIGPRLGDHAVKPEITAPGVAIVAARAEGTSLGNPVNDSYTALNGTSMATPHVAGAAAILRQKYPTWSPAQVKAALTGTSVDNGYTAYQQGAGRLDVGVAFQAEVLTDTATVDFGKVEWPQQDLPPRSETVTYRNIGDQPVTLELSAELNTVDGAAAPDGSLTVSPTSLEVPAGGTAEATVTFDPTLPEPALYSGVVLASAANVDLRVPVGVYQEPEGHDLSVEVLTPEDAAGVTVGSVIIRRVDADGEWIILPPGARSVHLTNGVYNVSTMVAWSESPGDMNNYAMLVNPQVEVTGDAATRLDTADADPIDIATPSRTERYGSAMTQWHIPDGGSLFGVASGQLPYGARAWVAPTQEVTVGTFFLEHAHLLGTPMATLRVFGHPDLRLTPRYQHFSAMVPKLEGSRPLVVVDAGTGSAEDFANVDVRGKVALIDIGDKALSQWPPGSTMALEELQRAADAGAVAVLAHTSTGSPEMGRFPGLRSWYPVPALGISADEAAALREVMWRGRAIVRITTNPGIPELYSLSYLERGEIPDDVRREVGRRNVLTLHQSFHDARPSTLSQQWTTRRPDLQPQGRAASSTMLRLEDVVNPGRRTEYVGPTSHPGVWQRQLYTRDLERFLAGGGGHTASMRHGYAVAVDYVGQPDERSEEWGSSPVVPGAIIGDPGEADVLTWKGNQCAVCRYAFGPNGDILPIFAFTTDSSGHHGTATGYANYPPKGAEPGFDRWRLFRDGTELPQSSLIGKPGMFPYYTLPPEAADYRLTHEFEAWQPYGGYGTTSQTTWTFTSQQATSQDLPDGYDGLSLCGAACRVEPLIFLRYHLNLRLDNSSSGPGVHVFTVDAYRQPSLSEQPRIEGLRLSASFDGGGRWYRMPTIPLGGGKYMVMMLQPWPHGPDSTVSLRTEAWDAAGNQVEQVVPDAYALVDWWSGGHGRRQ